MLSILFYTCESKESKQFMTYFASERSLEVIDCAVIWFNLFVSVGSKLDEAVLLLDLLFPAIGFIGRPS